MIPRSAAPQKLGAWRDALAEAVREPAELIRILGLDPTLLPAAEAAAARFPLRVPRGYLARMTKGDPDDPLLRQVLPLAEEQVTVAGFEADPVGDLQACKAPGLLQKYRGRALLLTTPACAIHCRFCFRRNFPYRKVLEPDWSEALATLRDEPEIEELILSGGDPLTLGDRRLGALVRELEKLPGLRRLRIHTRLPVVLPERVDDALLEWLGSGRLHKVVVIHANHAREIDGTVVAALARLSRAGATLLNQTVLLRGINDRMEALAELSEALFAAGVMPYYLHLLDRAAGTAHFEVAEGEARELVEGLRLQLPGYLVPRLVREVAGEGSKRPVG